MAILLKKGSKGTQVRQLQGKLGIHVDGDFGDDTANAVKAYQSGHGMRATGIVDDALWQKIVGVTAAQPTTSPTQNGLQKYKDVIIQGSTFPDKPYRSDVSISLNADIRNTYIPTLNKAIPNAPKGLKLLLTIMAVKEGFKKGTRSYRTNNPGNIGNTDNGSNRGLPTLADGILLQKKFIEDIVANKKSQYPMNKEKLIPPYYSKEIAKNPKVYGMSPWLPGYKFVFTGQIDQFVKIYSTGARGGNSYINMIVSYFKANGITITPESKLQDIIQMS